MTPKAGIIKNKSALVVSTFSSSQVVLSCCWLKTSVVAAHLV